MKWIGKQISVTVWLIKLSEYVCGNSELVDLESKIYTSLKLNKRLYSSKKCEFLNNNMTIQDCALNVKWSFIKKIRRK